MMDLRCTFLVVTSGNPWARSKRIWWPKMERVPVPVRSVFSTPRSRASRNRSRYWCINLFYRSRLEPRNRIAGKNEIAGCTIQKHVNEPVHAIYGLYGELTHSLSHPE